MKNCTNCGNQLDDNVKFCPVCGSKMQNEVNVNKKTEPEAKKMMGRCSNCGSVLSVDLKFCPVCGANCTTGEVAVKDSKDKSGEHASDEYIKKKNEEIVVDEAIKGKTRYKKKSDFKKKMPQGKKSVREKIEIVIMLVLLFVVGFNVYAYTYASYQTKNLNRAVFECDYDKAEHIANKLSNGLFEYFMIGDTSKLFATLKEQLIAEKYISEAFSEYKEDYLDASHTNLALDATYYYSAETFADKLSENSDSNEKSNDSLEEIADSLADSVLTLSIIMEQSEGYKNYISENKKNLFADPEHLVLIIEYGSYFIDNMGEYCEYEGYAVFIYNSSRDKYVLFGTCDTLDEDAGNLQAWIGIFDNSEIYNTDYDRLEDMEINGAFSTDATDSYSAMENSTEDDNYTMVDVYTESTTEATTETQESESGETAEEAALREELFDEIINRFYNRLENETVENFMLDYNLPYVDIDYSGDWLEIFSYTFEDVTGDGIDDLWIYSEEAQCNAWFTVYNGKIYALSPNSFALINTSRDSMYYRENGTFLRIVAGASSSVGYITYTIYSLSGQGGSMEMVAEEEVEYRFNNISSGTTFSRSDADEIYYYQWKRYSDGTATKNDKTLTASEADNYLADFSVGLIEYPSSGYSFSDYNPWE